MGSGCRVLRALVGAFVFGGVVWFLSIGILSNHAARMRTSSTFLSTGAFDHWRLIGRGSPPDLHLHYVSKRRVPNGPDPIHNRRASKARQPPGRF